MNMRFVRTFFSNQLPGMSQSAPQNEPAGDVDETGFRRRPASGRHEKRFLAPREMTA
jgi:hypothetical protein